MGPSELRHLVEKTAEGEPAALGGLDPLPGCTPVEVDAALAAVWGVTAGELRIDAARTVAAAVEASRRIAGISASGGSVVFATAAPASLLPLYAHLARLAGGAGAQLSDEPDSAPFICDGRSGRVVRLVGGVATVTDGDSVLATVDRTASDELLFVVGRPGLVVGDGPFAAGAVRAGLPVVAFAGVRGLAMGVAALRGEPTTVVPIDTGQHPSAYEVVAEVMGEAFLAALGDAP